MSDPNLEAQIVETIASYLGDIPKDKITSQTNLEKDLDVDSLESVELIMILEEKFGIEIEDSEAEPLKTIEDITKLITKKTSAQKADV